MMSKKVVKIICIVMAALMGISVLAVLFQVFAIDEMTVAPNTGVDDIPIGLLAAIIGVAVVILTVCLVLPKLKKRNDGEE